VEASNLEIPTMLNGNNFCVVICLILAIVLYGASESKTVAMFLLDPLTLAIGGIILLIPAWALGLISDFLYRRNNPGEVDSPYSWTKIFCIIVPALIFITTRRFMDNIWIEFFFVLFPTITTAAIIYALWNVDIFKHRHRAAALAARKQEEEQKKWPRYDLLV